MSLSDIQSMKALKLAKDIANKTNKNPVSNGTDLINLSFTKKYGQRKFDLIDPKFIRFNDSFLDDFGFYDTTGSVGQVTNFNGGLSLTNASGSFQYYAKPAVPLKAPYFAAILTVDSFANNTTPATQDTIMVGLEIDTTHYIRAWFNNNTKFIGFDVNTGTGNVTKLNAGFSDTALKRLAFTVNENHCGIWFDNGNGNWKLQSVYNMGSYYNLKDPTVLSQFKPYFYVYSGYGTLKLNNFQVGYWGGVGSRDEALVTYADGTPYRHTDGRYYVTYSTSGMADNNFTYTAPDSAGSASFRCAHMSVGLFDPNTKKIECVGKVFTNRNGFVLGDHAGHIVYDDTADQWYVMLTSWGDFVSGNVTTYLATLKDSPLNKISVIDSTLLNPFSVTKLDGNTMTGFIDPFLAKINGNWYLACSAGGIYLASGNSLTNMSAVGYYPSPNGEVWEGSRLAKVNGKWYVSGSNATSGFKIWDLNFNYIGTITVDNIANYAQAPHFMVIPIQENNSTRYIVLCNDSQNYKNYPNTRGNLIVYESNTVNANFESQYRLPSR